VVVDSAKASQSVHETPQEGDLMVLYYPTLKRYGHIGFVLKVLPDNRVETIEGNTSGAGSRDGWGCFAQNRAVTSHMRFLRWVP
jgi:surface antigen